MTEPVAWRATDRGKTLLTDDTEFILKMWKHNGFKIDPLYLLRELTDEEIDEIWVETCSDFKLIENGKTKGIINIYDVSRAILRKASEK